MNSKRKMFQEEGNKKKQLLEREREGTAGIV